MIDALIANCRAVLPSGVIEEAAVGISGGRIAGIYADATGIGAKRVVDAKGQFLIPGVIDCHVHWGYHPDDCETETRSAALGGVTTALRFHRKMGPYSDMGNELADIAAHAYCNVGYHLTLMTEEQAVPIPKYVSQWGITSFKLIMGYRGYEALNVVECDDAFVLRTMQRIAAVPGGRVCMHCENTDLVEWRTQEVKSSGRNDLVAWNEARPGYAEGEAVLRMGYLAKLAGCPIYIVHISCREALESFKELRRMGVDARGETCVHYLTLTAENAPGIVAKVVPPLRSAADVDALWAAVEDGTLDTIGTDHSPRSRGEKVKGSMWETIVGNVGVGSMLPVLLAEGVNKRRITLQRLVEMTAATPARLFNLPGKGRIEVGADADLVLVDLAKVRKITPDMLGSMSDYSLYDGWDVRGWPTMTMVNGVVVALDGKITAPAGTGRYVRRPGERS